MIKLVDKLAYRLAFVKNAFSPTTFFSRPPEPADTG